MRSLLLICFLIYPLLADELVIIKSISSSKKSFVINKGLADDIRHGQESLFSTRDASIAAKVSEVSRHFSIWKMSSPNSSCPFSKDEFVTFNNNIDNVWSQVAKLDYEFKLKEKGLTPLGTIFHSAFIIRGALSKGISESISDTTSSKAVSRKGLQLEVFYSKATRFFERLEWAVGLRYDKESTQIQDPVLTVPTYRYYLMGELTYHFPSFYKSKNNLYISLGFGLGQSQTQIDQQISAGLSKVIPIRLGLITPFSKFCLLAEASIESVSSEEEFSGGETQTSDIVNAKLALGIKF